MYSAIAAVLKGLPEELQSINQSINEAHEEPAIMAIAAKRGKYEEEDAKVKLAVWTVAW
jgi:vacuolar-type H+-ATPase subunit F/Vma7